MTAGRWRALSGGPLALLFLTFPGAYLPLDLVYAGPGIMAYATWPQAAQIFLWSAALALLMSTLACLVALALPARAIAVLYLTAIAFAVLHGLLLWSQYFTYSLEHQWVRQLAVVVLALAGGPYLVRRLRERHTESLRAVLRAGTWLMALVAVGCAVLLATTIPYKPAAAAQAPSAGARPSIFLITVDTLSALYLPMYGFGTDTAPQLAQFADGATVFLRNYSNSNLTTPGINSILLGTRPWTHRAIHIEARPLAAAPGHSLPALLKAAGYYTAAVATSPWAAPSNLDETGYFSAISEHNLCTAYDPMEVLPPELEVAVQSSLAWTGVHRLFVWASDRAGLCAGRHYDPELAFAEARRILAAAPKGQPLFLWVHLLPPHDPYITPPPFVGSFASDTRARDRASTKPPYGFEAREYLDFPGLYRMRYLEAIRYVDHHIGGFLDHLRATGQYAPALVVVTADHGESFTKFYGAHGGPALHEELVRVPLIIKTPGQSTHKEITQLSEQADLLPTLLELAGVAPLPKVDGISLVPALAGAQLGERPVYTMNFQQSTRVGPLDTGVVAMVEGEWKYVHYFGAIHYPYMPPLEDALYDLGADPTEGDNLVELDTERAERMRKNIEARLAEHARPMQ